MLDIKEKSPTTAIVEDLKDGDARPSFDDMIASLKREVKEWTATRCSNSGFCGSFSQWHDGRRLLIDKISLTIGVPSPDTEHEKTIQFWKDFERRMEFFANRLSPAGRYREHWQMGPFDVQYWLCTTKGKVDSLRIEWNPAKTRKEEYTKFWGVFSGLSCIKWKLARVTRIDWALDCLNSDHRIWQYMKTNTSKSNTYSDWAGVTTAYLGSRTSDLQIRIYNKRQELMDAAKKLPSEAVRPVMGGHVSSEVYDELPVEFWLTGSTWTRVEAQDRTGFTFFGDFEQKNPFQNLIVVGRYTGLLAYCEDAIQRMGLDAFKKDMIDEKGRGFWRKHCEPEIKAASLRSTEFDVWNQEAETVWKELQGDVRDTIDSLIYESTGEPW